MKTLFLALSVAALFALTPKPCAAESAGVKIEGVWSRATPPGATTGVIYFKIVNHGSTDDRLLRVDADVAKKVELHESREENGVMTMRPLEAVNVPAGAAVSFAPGGKHVMLMGLKAPLKAGTDFPATLVFEKAGAIETKVSVSDTAPSGATGMDMGSGAMGQMPMGDAPMDGMMHHN